MASTSDRVSPSPGSGFALATLVTWICVLLERTRSAMAAKPETPMISKIVGERGPAARNSQARTVAWAKFRPETKPDSRKDGRGGFRNKSSFLSPFLSSNSRQSLSPRGEEKPAAPPRSSPQRGEGGRAKRGRMRGQFLLHQQFLRSGTGQAVFIPILPCCSQRPAAPESRASCVCRGAISNPTRKQSRISLN